MNARNHIIIQGIDHVCAGTCLLTFGYDCGVSPARYRFYLLHICLLEQDGESIGDVALPPWAHGSARTFVEVCAAALESPCVTEMLPRWVVRASRLLHPPSAWVLQAIMCMLLRLAYCPR